MLHDAHATDRLHPPESVASPDPAEPVEVKKSWGSTSEPSPCAHDEGRRPQPGNEPGSFPSLCTVMASSLPEPFHLPPGTAAFPHGGPAGVGDGGTRIPSLDSPISNFLKASLIVRTAHAPSHASSPALALREGRTCSFTSCRPGAAGRWMRRNGGQPGAVQKNGHEAFVKTDPGAGAGAPL